MYSELSLSVTISAASLFPHVGVTFMVWINFLFYTGIVTQIFFIPFSHRYPWTCHNHLHAV